MRATLITTGSVMLTTGVIGNAFYHKKQFYPSVVYITKSNPSMAVIYIQFLVMILLIGKLMRKIFFGTLRAAELEHLIERAWYAVTETCLAFTVFRDDLNAKFVGFFALLLFLKCFHWLAEDRVDFMERSPNINILFHVRIVSLLTVLAACDITFIYFAYHTTLEKGADFQLVFGFEYAILLATILNIVLKYILHWIDIARDSPWDEKAVWLLYTELIMSALKVFLYLIFVGCMLKFHNFPLFVLRPIYLSLRTFKKAFCDVIMSRRAIRNMNTLYPNATQEELASSDNVCIICREEMTGNGASKKLPCNHIFHVSCLRSWFQRQQTCPTCRMDILRLPYPSSNTTNNNQANAVNNNNNNNIINNNNNNNNNNINNNVMNDNNNNVNVNVNDNNNNNNNSQNNNNINNNNQDNENLERELNYLQNNMNILRQQARNLSSASQQTRTTSPNQPASGAANPNLNQSQVGPNNIQVILQDQMAAVMIHTFAQMFVEAMLTHLQALNSNQQQQRQAQSNATAASTDAAVGAATSPSTTPTTELASTSSSSSSHPTTGASVASHSQSSLATSRDQLEQSVPLTTDQHQQTDSWPRCSTENASTQTEDPSQ